MLVKKRKTKSKLKVTYEYVKTIDSEARLEKAYELIFNEVLKINDG